MKKAIVIFGTRPEAIKLGPLILELKSRSGFECVVCSSGQHKEMLSQALAAFGIEPDYDLGAMAAGAGLSELTIRLIASITEVLNKEAPDIAIVHGDTTTTFAASLCAFYAKIPVAHVEAGLRTGRMDSPFPEEFNRQAAGILATWHFAPTEKARQNLLAENKAEQAIYVTGNTAIDALRYTVKPGYSHPVLAWAAGKRILLLTAHRRENWGEGLSSIFEGAKAVLNAYPDTALIYPVHPNPLVRSQAEKAFAGVQRARLIEALDVLDFHNFMKAATLILTDSGGIQEEAPSLGKPVLVCRDTTERPEGVDAGTLKLVGTEAGSIFAAASELLTSPASYAMMSRAVNPYGDGHASERIADVLEKALKGV